MARPVAPWLFAEMFVSADNKVWSTEFWYKGNGIVTPTAYDANADAQALLAVLAPPVAAILNDNFTVLGLRLNVNFGTGTFGGESHQTYPGGNSNEPMPEDVCAVVRKATSTGGASHAGRWRLSGLCQDSVTGSYLNTTGTTFLAGFQAAAIATYPATGGGSWDPAVYSRKLNTLTAIVSATADLLLGTARRRRSQF